MTQKQRDQIRRLFRLAEAAKELELIDLELTDQWCVLREELGLANLILMLKDYVTNVTKYIIEHKPKTQTPQTQYTIQNPNVLQ